MSGTDHYQTRFLEAAREWICDRYSIDVRYIQRHDIAPPRVSEMVVIARPSLGARPNSLRLAYAHVRAGLHEEFALPRETALSYLHSACSGRITIDGHTLALGNERQLGYHTEMLARDRWFGPLHLQVFGDQLLPMAGGDALAIDDALRSGSPPFDGMADLATFLSLSASPASNSAQSISMHVLPPVDLLLAGGHVKNDRLVLELHAYQSFDTSKIGLAIRVVPGAGPMARKQIASSIAWKRPSKGIRRGIVDISVKRADSVLAMVTIGGFTVRRHWFVDPAKARNPRLVALQTFDQDLKMIRQAVFESTTDSMRFEKGVAALLYALGFAPAIQLERDAPDLIVSAPSGRLVVVECTLRTADFLTKLGKLVDRRGALSKALEASGPSLGVIAVLVCALPRDQIAAISGDVSKHQAILLTREDLQAGVDRARFLFDPDKMLDEALPRAQ